jgi:hypothetical protein
MLHKEAYRCDRDIGKLPPVGAAPDRRQSYILRLRRVMGSGFIALRRSNIAHHRRSWPANLAKAMCSLGRTRRQMSPEA